jgi:hypothetical protein
MQLAAHAGIAAAIALASGGLFAVSPALSSSDVGADVVRLASSASDLAPELVSAGLLTQIQGDELSINAALISEEVTANQSVLADELGFESAIAPAFGSLADSSGPASILNGLLNDAFDFNRLFIGTGENVFDSLVGADNFDPAALTGGFGGLRGIMDLSLFTVTHAVQFADDETRILTGTEGTQPFPTEASLTTLQADELTACQALFNGELAFNSDLLHSEVAAETAALGSNNALNGLVDRLINLDNLMLSTDENALNSLLGVEAVVPSEITASLLTGVGGSPMDPTNVFDTGQLGGLEGSFDQGLAAFADALGLTPSQFSDAFAPGVFDPTAFTAALQGAIDTTAFTPFLTDLAPVLSDFGTILGSFF